MICFAVSPVVHRIRKRNEAQQVSIHLAHKQDIIHEKNHQHRTRQTGGIFLGETHSLPRRSYDRDPAISRVFPKLTKRHATKMDLEEKAATTTNIVCVLRILYLDQIRVPRRRGTTPSSIDSCRLQNKKSSKYSAYRRPSIAHYAGMEDASREESSKCKDCR